MRGQQELVFDRYIFDADSLINLERSDNLKRLRPPGDAITVPDRVAREVREPGSLLHRWLERYPHVVSRFATPSESAAYVALKVADPSLGDGEASAIAMARERQAVLVMDDVHAGEAARRHGVVPIGTDEFLRRWHVRR